MSNETNMVAACPKCRARYRIEAGRLTPDGVRLRCSQCDAVFRVTPPAREEVKPMPVEPAPVAVPTSASGENTVQSPAAQSRSDERASAASDVERPPNGGPCVVIADSDIDAGKRVSHALAEWGYAPVLVHDGVEAILTIQRLMPRAVLLDAGLTKMFGFQVCELMKRNESLSSIHVVLIGAIHHEARYRREPAELYGADAYLERPQLPEALRAILRGFGLHGGSGMGSNPPPAEPAPESGRGVQIDTGAAPTAIPDREEAGPPNVARRASDASGASDEPAESEEHTAARRLARIIVSDIVLYNAEKFDAGVRSGDVVAVLAAELTEGRGLLAQRVSERLCDGCDFVAEELVRVARARGMTG